MNERKAKPSSADHRETRIPINDEEISTDLRHSVPIDLASEEAREELVDISALGIASESYYRRQDGFNAPYYRSFYSAPASVSCRKTVAKKLLAVNLYLEQYSLEIFVWDAFRPLACQQEIWEYFIKEARRLLQKANREELVAYASQYCSNPNNFVRSDPRTWPTHLTGGAVDLTLRRKATGELLFMGGTFDDPSPISHTDYYERGTLASSSASAREAQRNRRLLYWAMQSVGFANYPREWWHFDWGNQMWVIHNLAASDKPRVAFYGPADTPANS